MDRETVACPQCGAGAGEPCDLDLGAAVVEEDGEARRPVHAGRYAATLPPNEVGPFWEAAIDKYLTEQMAADIRPPSRGGLPWPI